MEVEYLSPRVQHNRKFADAGRYLDGYSLHPSGQALGITTRGKAYTFYAQEGPVVQYGKRDGVRYRQPVWLHDGRRLLLVTDEPGEETLEIYHGQPNRPPERLEGLDLGRVVSIKSSPLEDKVALTNHRYELILIDLAAKTLEVIDRSAFVSISGFDWSPDGAWLAYSLGATSRTSEIRLYQLPTEEEGAPAEPPPPDSGPLPLTPRGRRHTVTRPVLHDVRPAFDPEGKHLYFLSYREFNPVYDGLHFDLGFPWGMRPYLITLRDDLPNPFIPVPELGDEHDEDDEESHDEAEDEGAGDDEDGGEDDEPSDKDDAESDEDEEHDEDDEPGEDESDEDESDEDDGDESDFWRTPYWLRSRRAGLGTRMAQARAAAKKSAPAKEDGAASGGRGSKADKRPRRMRIDLEGIDKRIVAFPVPDARYGQIAGIPGKALFTVYPIQGQLDDGVDWGDEEDETGSLPRL